MRQDITSSSLSLSTSLYILICTSNSATFGEMESAPLKRCRDHDDQEKSIRKKTRERDPQANFLGLPQELRDLIHDFALPWGNYHIQYARESFSEGTFHSRAWRLVQGKGLTGKRCLHNHDHEQAIRWMNGQAGSLYLEGYEEAHFDCLYPNKYSPSSGPGQHG